ncbi:unnamed protein product [Miscanthus lutarioriparius]|uniref:Uncharacterized protein n=1 Tax=Miscanthus lutarioriparius TaxID=422564 RepID=A0A811NHP3_9POAL|nr:unnamed protein product [Miscanthus lutarioriparius]
MEIPLVSGNVTKRAREMARILGSEFPAAAIALKGIMKEAESAIGLLRGDQEKNNAKIACTDRVRHCTLLIMLELCDECSAVPEPTVCDITGDLNSNESDNKLADNGNHEERGNVSENKNSKKELARNEMDESNRTDENQQGPFLKAGTEKQVDLVGSSNNEGYSSTSKKLKDVLKDQHSPLVGKARGHKKVCLCEFEHPGILFCSA